MLGVIFLFLKNHHRNAFYMVPVKSSGVEDEEVAPLRSLLAFSFSDPVSGTSS